MKIKEAYCGVLGLILTCVSRCILENTLIHPITGTWRVCTHTKSRTKDYGINLAAKAHRLKHRIESEFGTLSAYFYAM